MKRTQEKTSGDASADHDENYQFSGATLKISSNDGAASPPASVDPTQPASSILSGSDATSIPYEPARNSDIVQGVTEPAQPAVYVKPRVGTPKHFFSFRDGLFEQAIQDCQNILLRPANDTDIVGSWLLTEISHWDHERERIFILTTKTLLEVKYDFISLRILKHTKLRLGQIDTILKGKITYPETSLLPQRSDTGIRVMWNKGQPLPLLTYWNPFANDIPWITIIDHPLYSYKDPFNSPYITQNLEKYHEIYSVDGLHDALLQTISNYNIQNTDATTNCKFTEGPILLENYVGVGAMIHNKNNFGFFKVRGKFSF